MASKAKAEANRRNAARSTGPRSAQGKSSSAQNARRHGFAGGNAIAQSMESQKIERLACAIAGTDQDPHRLYYARVIAETQLRLALIAKAKIKLIVLVMYRLPAMRTLEPRLWSSRACSDFGASSATSDAHFRAVVERFGL